MYENPWVAYVATSILAGIILIILIELGGR